MSAAESPVEEQVRQLASVGLSTRRIAQVLGDVSQSTVVRVLHKINTGPQPILRDKASSGQLRTALLIGAGVTAALLALALLVLTAAVATIAWR